MAYTYDDIFQFLEKEVAVPRSKMTPETDLYRDLGVEGDDFAELTESYATNFGVAMGGYRWYFHHGDEPGFNPGALIFRPPHARVERIPVTPKLLLESANLGKWALTYPEHDVDLSRKDIVFSQIVAVLGILALVVICLKSLLSKSH